MKLLFLIILTLNLNYSFGKYGGNDIFTSLEAMKILWARDIELVNKMETIIQNMKEVIPHMERYVKNHKKLELDQEPNVEYLGHPINAYNLIKHSAIGWKFLNHSVVQPLNITLGHIDYIVNRPNHTNIPDHDEIHGAAFGVGRLHSLYALNTTQLVNHGIIQAELNQRHILSDPSIKRLSSWDLGVMGGENLKQSLISTGLDLVQGALEAKKLETSGEIIEEHLLDNLLEPPMNTTFWADELPRDIDYHDQLLLRLGSRGHKYRLKPLPIGNKLKKKDIKKIAKREKNNAKDIITVDNVEDPFGVKTPDHYVREQHNFAIDNQKELLCTGNTWRNATETKDLKCFYGHSNSPWLKLGPIKIEVQNKEPYLAVLRELLYPHECDNITQFLGPLLGTPPGRMKGGVGKNDWTMKNVWPTEEDNIHLEKMTRRVEHITNLFASSKLGQSDNFMCGNYGIGGHYGTHPDYHPYKNQEDEKINRISTVMVNFFAPEAGGATVWPFVGAYVFPQKGSAVWWFNTKSDSVPDPETKHAACPVLLGQKWIGNKWIAYSSQFRNRPCDLQPNTRYKGLMSPSK